MKNIVKVLRFKDNAARLYILPEGVTVKEKTLVTVEYQSVDATAVGVAVTDSYEVDDNGAKMVAAMHHMRNLDTLKKVLCIYDGTRLDWPVEEDPDEDVPEVESDARDD